MPCPDTARRPPPESPLAARLIDRLLLRERNVMKHVPSDFRVHEGHAVKLKHWPTAVEPIYRSKLHYHRLLAEHVEQLSKRQRLLYASDQFALLVIFQAMDAAGKDGA